MRGLGGGVCGVANASSCSRSAARAASRRRAAPRLVHLLPSMAPRAHDARSRALGAMARRALRPRAGGRRRVRRARRVPRREIGAFLASTSRTRLGPAAPRDVGAARPLRRRRRRRRGRAAAGRGSASPRGRRRGARDPRAYAAAPAASRRLPSRLGGGGDDDDARPTLPRARRAPVPRRSLRRAADARGGAARGASARRDVRRRRPDGARRGGRGRVAAALGRDGGARG